MNRWARVDQDIVTAHASGGIGTLARPSGGGQAPPGGGTEVDFRGVARALEATARVGHAQDIIRGAYDRHASRWLADEAGISPCTPRAVGCPAPHPRSRAGAIIAAARSITHPYGIAAARLRGLAAAGGRVSVGTGAGCL